MRDLRRISALGVVLIILLRISIGWQFLYEGLWKLESMKTAQPWSAEGYLKNAQGPFRNYFRNLTGRAQRNARHVPAARTPDFPVAREGCPETIRRDALQPRIEFEVSQRCSFGCARARQFGSTLRDESRRKVGG